MNGPPRLWTGEAVLDYALEVAGFKVEDLRRSMEVTREAMLAERENGDPDHAIRLRASENVFGWVGLRGTRKPADASTQPVSVNVTIVSSDSAQGQLESHGRAIRVISGDGEGA